jgi:hypothetical protein
MLVLQGFQLPVEGVVLGVGDLRRVIDVVAAVVVTDLLAQILYPIPNVRASGHAGIIRTYAPAPKRSLVPPLLCLGLALVVFVDGFVESSRKLLHLRC